MTSGSSEETRVTRTRVVLVCLLGVAMILAAAMSTWVSTRVGDAAGSSWNTSTGLQAVPAIVPLALAAGAGALALTLVDGWARRVVAAVVALCGVAVLVLAGTILLDPGAVAATAHDSFSAPASSTSEGPGEYRVVARTHVLGPIGAGVGGVTTVLGALLALARGDGWATRAARKVSGPRARRHRSDWERLTDGEDPT